MILALYETNYPARTAELPNWKKLPFGYFSTGLRRPNRPTTMTGQYFVGDPRRGPRPREGEHFLVVFSLNGERQSWIGTLSALPDRLGREQQVVACALTLHNQLRVW